MKKTTTTNPLRTGALAVALAATILAPVAALAATGESAAVASGSSEVAATASYDDTDWESMSTEDYIAALPGLTDDEKAELVSLYDKAEALGEDEDLSDEEWTRFEELEGKVDLAETKEHIEASDVLTSDEKAELTDLCEKAYALEDGQDLTDAEWTRFEELEGKIELAETTDYINASDALTGSEKQELIGLYEKAYALEDGQDLTDAEWTRAEELEAKIELAETKEYIEASDALTDAEKAELTGLYEKAYTLEDGQDLTEDEWTRAEELEQKIFDVEMDE